MGLLGQGRKERLQQKVQALLDRRGLGPLHVVAAGLLVKQGFDLIGVHGCQAAVTSCAKYWPACVDRFREEGT